MEPSPPVSGQLGAYGAFAQVTGAVPGIVLNGEFYFPRPSQWNRHTLNRPVGSQFATVTFGGVFTFPATPSGIHFVGTLLLTSTSPTSAPITYNVVMDHQGRFERREAIDGGGGHGLARGDFRMAIPGDPAAELNPRTATKSKPRAVKTATTSAARSGVRRMLQPR